MEPEVVELDEPTHLVSNAAPPPLAIRAVLSRDDSDGETSVLSDAVPLDEIETKGFTSTNSSSYGSDIDDEAFGVGERPGLLEKAPSEFSTPMLQIPIAKITADEEEDDDDELVIGEKDDQARFYAAGNSIDVKNFIPKVRAFRDKEIEFEEEEGFETASEDAKDDDDVFVDYGLDEEEAVDELSGQAFQGHQMNSVGVMNFEGVNLGGDEEAIEEQVSVDMENIGVSQFNESDEDKDYTQVSETKDSGTSVDEEIASVNAEDVVTDDLKVLTSVDGAAERSQQQEMSVSADSGNGETHGDVDYVSVTGSEGGDNVAETVQRKDLVAEPFAVREPVSGVSKDPEVGDAMLTDEQADDTQVPVAPEIPDLAQSGNDRNDGGKFSNQEDSVADKVNVDVVEELRTGAVIVGEHEALKGIEADKNESAVRKELGSSIHDTNSVDDVAVPEAMSDFSVINADGVSGRDKEIAEDTNDSGLDNLHFSESTVEVQDGHEPETDEESLGDSTEGLIIGGSATARQFMQEQELEQTDGQIAATDSEEEADSDNEQDGNKLFDSSSFAALLKAATSANMDSSNPTVTSQDITRLFSADRPAGLGPTFRPTRPLGRADYSSIFPSPGATSVSEEKLTEEEKTKLDKLQQLRVKFIRLLYRLGHSVEHSVAANVLYRLALVAGRPSVPSFSLEVAKQTALKLEEEEGMDGLNFSLNILVLGKSGVGKSATINSIFGREKVRISAFEPGTKSVNQITGVVSGVNIRVIDTPGLRSSALDHGYNNKVLASVKNLTKKFQPDVVLYVDRLDARTKDLNDLPMLRTITSSLGPSIWRNAIIALTHAAYAPPDGPSGSPLSYEVYVAQRSHTVQQCIRQAVGDFRLMGSGMMNPISLVENHYACRENREGQKVLPNGQTWRPQLMVMCFSTKVLSEATSISKPQDSVEQRKLFGFRGRSLPLPYLLSSLLQPRAHPKLASDQGGDDVDSDVDLDDFSDLEGEEEEDEYDQLPPFKPLRKGQFGKLSKEQKEAYLEEFDYRVKLLQKKQWKEELKRIKNKGTTADDYNYDEENEAAPSAVPVTLPDMALPQTFDGDNPSYRYRFMEPTSQFLARPLMDVNGWDHDVGYDSIGIEQSLGIAGRFPAALTVQVRKDKKDFTLHLDSSVAAKHGEHRASMVGFDVQNIGQQMGYVVRGETKYKKLKKNKLAAGGSVTFLGGNVATGLKLEDQISVGKRLMLLGSTGMVRSKKDGAYGANLEIRLRDADHPIGQDQSSILLSLMKWNGDIGVGANLQSQVSVGRNTKMTFRAALNNKRSGQITVKMSSSDHTEMALASLIPIAISIFRSIRPEVSQEDYDM